MGFCLGVGWEVTICPVGCKLVGLCGGDMGMSGPVVPAGTRSYGRVLGCALLGLSSSASCASCRLFSEAFQTYSAMIWGVWGVTRRVVLIPSFPTPQQKMMQLCQENECSHSPSTSSSACGRRFQGAGPGCQDLCRVLPTLCPGTAAAAPTARSPPQTGASFSFWHRNSFGGDGGRAGGRGSRSL